MTSTPAQRINEVLNSCRIIDDNTVETFASFCRGSGIDFEQVFRGKPVLDIGCGRRGGLCSFVTEQGATNDAGKLRKSFPELRYDTKHRHWELPDTQTKTVIARLSKRLSTYNTKHDSHAKIHLQV